MLNYNYNKNIQIRSKISISDYVFWREEKKELRHKYTDVQKTTSNKRERLKYR